MDVTIALLSHVCRNSITFFFTPFHPKSYNAKCLIAQFRLFYLPICSFFPRYIFFRTIALLYACCIGRYIYFYFMFVRKFSLLRARKCAEQKYIYKHTADTIVQNVYECTKHKVIYLML